MTTQHEWDLRFLNLAKHISQWSKDPSTKVGAVIVDDRHRIVSVGFNGFPAQMEDRQEWLNDREAKYSRIIHAEINAITFAQRPNLAGCTLYTYPLCPCDRCMPQVAQNEIMRVVAPHLPLDLQERWGNYTELSKQYAQDMNISMLLIDMDSSSPGA